MESEATCNRSTHTGDTQEIGGDRRGQRKAKRSGRTGRHRNRILHDVEQFESSRRNRGAPAELHDLKLQMRINAQKRALASNEERNLFDVVAALSSPRVARDWHVWSIQQRTQLEP